MCVGLVTGSFRSAIGLRLGRNRAQGLDNRVEAVQKLFAVGVLECAQNDVVDLDRGWFDVAQRAPAVIGQLHGVGTGILTRAAALQQVLLEHPAHDVCECRAVNAGLFDEMRLTQAFITGHGHEHGKLTRRKIGGAQSALEYVARTLSGPMQEMNGGTIQFRSHVNFRLRVLRHVRRCRSVRIVEFLTSLRGQVHFANLATKVTASDSTEENTIERRASSTNAFG